MTAQIVSPVRHLQLLPMMIRTKEIVDSHRGFSKIVLLFISFSAAIDDISTNSCAAVKDDDYGIGGYLYQVINDTKQLIALVSSITLDCSR
jgi:hypothetical protein